MPPRTEQDDSTPGPRIMVPHPDPTVRTTEEQRYADRMLRELIETKFVEAKEANLLRNTILETRLTGMDRAIELVREEANRFPAQIDEKIEALGGVHEEKFSSIQKQFMERDERTKTVAELNQKAIDAALAAAKEMVNKQQEGTDKATARVEGSMKEQIGAMSLLVQNGQKTSDDKIGDLKERLTRIEGKSEGGGQVWGYIIGSVGLVAAVVVAVAAFVKH